MSAVYKINRIKEAQASLIKWSKTEKQLEFNYDLPLVINRKGEVLLGNSLYDIRKNYKTHDVVVVSVDDYMKEVALRLAPFLRIEENLNALIGEQFASFNKLMRAIRRAGKL